MWGFFDKKKQKKTVCSVRQYVYMRSVQTAFFFMPGVIGNKNCFFNKLLRCSNKSF